MKKGYLVANLRVNDREIFAEFSSVALPLIEKYGGEFVFAGSVSRLMLGEVEEMWDEIAIAKYPSRKAMFEMTMDPDYQKIHVHRDAGLKGQLNIETI